MLKPLHSDIQDTHHAVAARGRKSPDLVPSFSLTWTLKPLKKQPS